MDLCSASTAQIMPETSRQSLLSRCDDAMNLPVELCNGAKVACAGALVDKGQLYQTRSAYRVERSEARSRSVVGFVDIGRCDARSPLVVVMTAPFMHSRPSIWLLSSSCARI